MLKNKYTYVIVLLIAVFIVYSCRKQDLTDTNVDAVQNDLTIDGAKSYIGKNPKLSSEMSFNSSPTNKVPLTKVQRSQKGFPLWNRAKRYDVNGFQVVEVPFVIENGVTSVYNFSSGNNPDSGSVRAKASFSRLLIFRKGIADTLNKTIVTYIPDLVYLRKHHYDASSNWINKLDKDFSGYIEYKTWSQQIKYVLRVEDGKVKKRYNVSSSDPSINARTSAGSMQTMSCTTVCVPEYQIICAGPVEGGSGGSCEQVLIGETCTTYCDDGGDNPPTDPNPGGGGTGDGGGSSSIGDNVTVLDLYNGEGVKPIDEYPDKCSGAVGLWSLSTSNQNRESFGVLTTDGQFMAIAVLGSTGGEISGLYMLNNTAYYSYPDTEGPPSRLYTGLEHKSGRYFIPIAATVHTHSPCITDGTNGISNMILSNGDQNLASVYNTISHYIIGCDALGSFVAGNSSPILLQSGALSATCSLISP